MPDSDHQARRLAGPETSLHPVSGTTSGAGPTPLRHAIVAGGTVQSSSMKQARSAPIGSSRLAPGSMTVPALAGSKKSTPRSTDQPVRHGRRTVLATSVAFNLNMVPTLQDGRLTQVVHSRD
ncbi:MAG: hypothetical protein ACOH1E_08695 [Brevundimonas sp.]